MDILTGIVYDGDIEIDMYRPLDLLPVLAVQGSIIPMDGETVPANGCPNPSSFGVIIVVGANGHFDIVEDSRNDDKSKLQSQAALQNQRRIPIEFNQADGRLKIVSMRREWKLQFISLVNPSTVRVIIDDTLSTEAQCTTSSAPPVPSTVVTIPTQSNPDALITVELGPNPQLAVLDHSQRLRDMLLDFQISNNLKNNIWEVIQADRPATLKMAQLISLGLESNWVGPLAELLLADSR